MHPFRDGRLVDRKGQLFPDINGATSGDTALKRIRDELGKPTGFMFNDVEFADVVLYLSDFHGTSIRINARALDEANVLPGDLRITCSLGLGRGSAPGGMSLRAALQIVLEPHELAPVIRHGMLLITTRQDADSWKDRTGVTRIRDNASSPFAKEFAKPTMCQFNETPLKDVCTHLSDLHNISIQVDASALEQLADVLITSYFQGITLADTLQFILDQHGLCCVDSGTTLLIRPVDSMNAPKSAKAAAPSP